MSTTNFNSSKVKNCQGKETLQRLNYLYQIGNTYLSPKATSQMAFLYTDLLVNISRKAVQKIEPTLKRSICKKCHNLLVAGESAKVRIKKKRLIWTCRQCHITKTFPAVPDYGLWMENPLAVVETVRY